MKHSSGAGTTSNWRARRATRHDRLRTTLSHHTAKLMELSLDLPLVSRSWAEAIERFLPTVERLVGEGLVTLEAVRIVK
jgi:hypothetical protein